MSIKNFNKMAVSKLAAFALVGTLAATTLAGCRVKVGGKKTVAETNVDENTVDRNNLLKGTILENTCVVTFEDGSKDIAVAVSNCPTRDSCPTGDFHHYYSVISGEYFSDESCYHDVLYETTAHHYKITNEENITGYLTADELTKAIQGKLEENDIIAIVGRTIAPTTEETNTKAR